MLSYTNVISLHYANVIMLVLLHYTNVTYIMLH